jgi:hypothetical protein
MLELLGLLGLLMTLQVLEELRLHRKEHHSLREVLLLKRVK